MQPNEAPPAATAPEAPPAKIKPAAGQNEQVINLLDVIVDEADRKAVVKQELARLQFNQNYRLAEMFAQAGYFDSNGYNSPPMTAAQAMAKIAVGENWDLNPADSIRFIYIVGGKPSIEEAVFAARLQEAGWGWDVQFIGGQGAGCKGVRLFAERDGKPLMKPVRDDVTGEIKMEGGKPVMRQAYAEFTEEQAAQIKIWQNKQQVSLLNKSGPWSDGRRANMYYWRALSQFRRWFCPQVMKGAILKQEALDFAVDELDVVDTSERNPRPALFDAIDAELKQKPEAKPALAETEAPKPETKKAEPETKKATAETTAPVSKALPSTLKEISKLEALLGSKQYEEILQKATFATLGDVFLEDDAQRVLNLMIQATKAKK